MNAAIRVVVILMMTVVGLGLTIGDFRRLGKQPRLGLLGTVGQLLLLPHVVLGASQGSPAA